MTDKKVCVIGGGLAGTEAAWQLAQRGINVHLYEMRPKRKTGAHHTDKLSELVCSNSLGSFDSKNASALLKAEMRAFNSLIIETAWKCKVPAGGALAVDRESFSAAINDAIANHPLITLEREEMEKIPDDGVTIVATGPLTSPALVESIQQTTGVEQLHFFDAAAPILTRESVNMDIAFEKSRYDKGDGVYINCPMDKEQYLKFWQALIDAERVELKDFEKDTPYFESCLPVEVIASRGVDTLRYGPLKPVGLRDPRTQKNAYAVVQLRQDNAAAKLYNIVGFQTNLKWPEQKRIFAMIPGLENAEFVRLGVMHRNTYLNSPVVLSPQLNLRKRENVFFAGQLTGVEGYSESTATGIIAAINAAQLLNAKELLTLPGDCMLGALIRYITSADPKHFQPINSNWGIIDTPAELMKLDKIARREEVRKLAMAKIAKIAAEYSVQAAVPAI
jgi:methylenetetrahydrofolate--tRNA-(uracil-5-)-methyltransferase